MSFPDIFPAKSTSSNNSYLGATEKKPTVTREKLPPIFENPYSAAKEFILDKLSPVTVKTEESSSGFSSEESAILEESFLIAITHPNISNFQRLLERINKTDLSVIGLLDDILQILQETTDPEKFEQLKQMAQLLRSLDLNIEEKDVNGDTLLIRSAKAGNVSAVQLLVSDFNASTQAKNKKEENALISALNVLQQTPPESPHFINVKSTVLYLARHESQHRLKQWFFKNFIKENEFACKILLECGICIDHLRDQDGNTLLIQSSKEGNLKLVELSLRLGADIYAKNHRKENAYLCVENRLRELIEASPYRGELLRDVMYIHQLLSQFMALKTLMPPESTITKI